jgi:hypothetical protein
MWSLKHAGWCTPTVIVTVLGALVCLVLLVQLITGKSDDGQSRKEIAMSLVSHAVVFALVAGLMFYLCAAGKCTAAWWLFGLFYLLPLAIMIVLLMISAWKKSEVRQE